MTTSTSSSTVSTTPRPSTKTSSTPATTTPTSTITTTTTGAAKKAVSLFDYGVAVGDQECVYRKTDFTCPLLEPPMGFPFLKKLRNFLYYTDNGQIVFPISTNNVFSYTNPTGFSNNFNVAMIGVFWDDADFSKNVGTTYYQVYNSTSNTTATSRVESMIRKYSQTPYTAQWTLKITWVKAPAYGSNYNLGNTYQAVLTTDGYVSYILMLYQDGGMNWDVTIRTNNVTIGYSSGSNDVFFKNDPLMEKTAAEKYRPDAQVQVDPDLRGLWMYALNNETLINNRMTCLSWYNSQPSPSSWNTGLLSCPCLYQQGSLDFRYMRSRPDQSGTKMLRPVFPNWRDAGVRCVYSMWNDYIQGFQERNWKFGGNDLETSYYDVCCNQVSDPKFCSMYMEKRPAINCRKYRPLFFGWMFGDPHITTLDSVSYTFNGLGDFLLLSAEDSGISLTLQGRTVQTGSAMATNFQAFALNYNSTTANITVEWYLTGNETITTYVNGQVVSYTYSNDLQGDMNNDTSGVFLMKDSHSVHTNFEGLLTVTVSASFGMMNAITNLPNQFLNKTKGLMGTWNNDKTDEFTSPNGTVISSQSTEEEIFRYGMTWEVTESLFSKVSATARSANTFTPLFLSDLKNQNSEKYASLLILCGNNTECLFDALSTNDTSIGLATLTTAQAFKEANTTLNSNPPVINGNATILSFIGEKTQAQFSANVAGVNFITDVSYKDVNLTSDGLLTWLPSSADGFTMWLIATDSQNLSSSIKLNFYLCDCRLKTQCVYTDLSRVNTSSVYVAGCSCADNYTDTFCRTAPNPCTGGCFPGVQCDNITGCGSCPAGLSGNGLHCEDIDECLQNNTCSPNADCTNTYKSYSCVCKQGFTGKKYWHHKCFPFAGNGTVCTCGECEANYCNNGGTCTRVGTSCTQKCTCPPAFIDDRCIIAGNNFPAQLKASTKMRTISLTIKNTGANFTDVEAYSKVNEVLSFIPQYKNATGFLSPWNESDFFISNVTAQFMYVANLTIIQFLNNELVSTLRTRLGITKRATSNLTVISVEDGFKLTKSELQNSLSCELNGYGGYTLDAENFQCVSVCNSYCKNNAKCEQILNKTLCSCVSFSIYTTSGAQCENLTMNLNAFFGILFGALAFLFLLLLGIGLGIYCYRKRKNKEDDTERLHPTEFSWKKSPISGFNKLKESTIPTLTTDKKEPHLVSWRPHLEKVDNLYEVKIKRPESKTLETDGMKK
ncbi:mucin-4 [Pelobates fuscus]|uniref:mucin-4 n=1 Tax=Pelobates fuscus TaxID=191477 RepID=UPI002FE49065